jgi:RNA polymerase sigma factor (sigma-70 family)
MPGTRASRLFRRLHSALPGPASGDDTDAHLLERYVASRDAQSFAAIVQRHGPLVWGVCRRLLADHRDAEDAFQATFLVLVRRAASVVPRQMVGNWLHGVARRTALKGRALAARRRKRECQVIDMPEREASPPEAWADVRAVIDEELTHLPGRYRAVVLLCDLDGKTRDQAATELGVPVGTVAGWLWRGRRLLARRLTRRGVTLAAAPLAAALGQYEASAKVPAAIESTTVEVAVRFAVGTLASGTIRAPVAMVTQGVLHSMWLSKFRAVLTLVVAAAIIGTGVTGLAIRATAGDEPKPKAVPEPRAGKPADETAGDPPDLRKIKQEVDRLRGELEEIKKQINPASRPPTKSSDDSAAVLTIRIYPVAELMSEPKDEALVRVITNTVRPTTWSIQGGQGTIEYFAAGKCLVVNQTQPVHAQIEQLLNELASVKKTLDDAKRPKN